MTCGIRRPQYQLSECLTAPSFQHYLKIISSLICKVTPDEREPPALYTEPETIATQMKTLLFGGGFNVS